MVELIPFTLLVFWLVPWVIAVARDVDRHGWILALCLLTGWTLVGWFAALYLALRMGGEDRPVARAPVIPLHRDGRAGPRSLSA